MHNAIIIFRKDGTTVREVAKSCSHARVIIRHRQAQGWEFVKIVKKG